jgi:hypothetical protein
MASKGIFTNPSEWWKHLKPFNKKLFHKAERKATKAYISKSLADPELFDGVIETIGLHKSSQEVRKLKFENGDSVIPEGIYCDSCPYWDRAKNKEVQNNGFCWFMEQGDWQVDGLSLLWDGCKECGIKEGEEFENIELEP